MKDDGLGLVYAFVAGLVLLLVLGWGVVLWVESHLPPIAQLVVVGAVGLLIIKGAIAWGDARMRETERYLYGMSPTGRTRRRKRLSSRRPQAGRSVTAVKTDSKPVQV